MNEALLWKNLTPEAARAHPGYGLRGWLGLAEAANALLLIVSALGALSLWTNGAPPAELAGETAPIWAMRGLMTLTAGLLAVIAALLRLRRAWSPMTIIMALAALEGATLVYDLLWPSEGTGAAAFLLGHGVSIAIVAGLARWLLRGFGPNLTFRHRLRAHAS